MVRIVKPDQKAEIEEKNFYQNVFNNQEEESELEDLETFFFSDEEKKIEKKDYPFKGSFYEPRSPRLYY